ncbi:MAG: T9SS type A sorting domain-containing protein, partial [Flavobacteriales bacterium]
FLIECTSVIDIKSSYSIYPNPVLSTLNVDLQGLKTIKLINSIGQVVYQLKTSKNLIDLSAISDGFYVIQIDKEVTE